MFGLLCVSLVGSLIVAGTSFLLRAVPWLRNGTYRRLFVISHTLLIILLLILSPIEIKRAKGSTYGDVYWPYLVVPGICVYGPVRIAIDREMPPILEAMGVSREFAPIVVVVLAPGLGGCITGGLLWYTIGCIVDRSRRKHSDLS